MTPSTVVPACTFVLGQSLLPGRIFALSPMLQPCPTIALSIETSFPTIALSPMMVDFTEQLLPITALSKTIPDSKLVPASNCAFSFNTVPGRIWTSSPSDAPFSTQAGPLISALRPIVTSPLANTPSPGSPIILASRGGSLTRFRKTQLTPSSSPSTPQHQPRTHLMRTRRDVGLVA